jgi:predicted DNA-binding protein (MmcQ/YjbR family)
MATITLDWLRGYALAFPGATEQIQWGADLLFKVGGKMFVVTGLESAEENRSISIKTTPEEFARLTELEGIAPSAYTGRYHWITIRPEAPLKRKEIEALVTGSYELVFSKLPKRVRDEIAAAGPARNRAWAQSAPGNDI